jgi:dTDP-4-dehydrorhamnose 3,5-epimerase-like enzyme
VIGEIINLPKITDPRGNLSVIEGFGHIPFEIKRTYLIYDVPGGQTRGGHAFRKQCEFIVSLSGSFDVHLDDVTHKKVYSLNRSYYGLYVPPMIWRSMQNFSTNALCLVLSSTVYDPGDYLRDFSLFLETTRQGN